MTDVAERAPLLGNDDGDPNQPRPSAESVEEEQPRQQPRWNRSDGQFRIGRFTSLEKMLFILSVTLLILLFVFIGLFARSIYHGDSRPVAPPSPTSTPTATPSPKMPKCESPKCVITAAEILRDLDLSVDPCNDFFAFTCNNWMKSHKIPDGKSSTGTMLNMFNENLDTLHEIFENDFDAIDRDAHDKLPNPERLLDKQNFGKAKAMYDSCMNESAINARGAEPVLPLLRDIRDSFMASGYAATRDGNFVEQDSKSSATSAQRLTRTIARLAKAGVNAFFSADIDLDLENPIAYRVYIFQSGLTLPSKEYYKQQDFLDTLFETVAQTMDLVLGSSESEFGWNRWSANTTARLVVNFEKELASISDPPEILREPKTIYNPRTLSQLTASNPSVDWDLLLSHMLPSTAPHQDTVILTSPEYIQRLSTDIIEKSTDRTIQAYLLWRAIYEYVHTLSDDVRLPVQRMEAKLQGTSVKLQKPRWEMCLDRMQESMGFLMGRYFVQKRFNGDSKVRADEFVLSIKDAFKRRLPELTWLDEVTKQRAMEKVDNVIFKIGYPTSSPDLLSPVSISHYYSELSVQPNNYFRNYMNGREWSVKRDWRKLGTDPDRGLWLMYPQEVNAYASEGFTEIVFPAGILQPPQFSSDYPDYLNYGGIGMVVGHELTHHFDPSGSLFDKDGRMVDWWTNETRTHFNEKTQCFIDQYSNYTIDVGDGKKLNVNGHFTLGENVADNGGIAAAFSAWKATYKEERNMLLPGLDGFTPDQLFFISFGRNWCFKATKEALVQQVLTDEHAPKMLRVRGVIQNSKVFSEVFNCPVGSPMNPEHKCEIW